MPTGRGAGREHRPRNGAPAFRWYEILLRQKKSAVHMRATLLSHLFLLHRRRPYTSFLAPEMFTSVVSPSYLKETSYRFSVAVIVLNAAPGSLTPSTSSAAIGEVPLTHFVWYRTGTCACRQKFRTKAACGVDVLVANLARHPSHLTLMTAEY